MATDAEYEQRIGTFKHKDLLWLWQNIQTNQTQTDDWDSGKAFEYLILRAFQLEGAEVRWPYSVKVWETLFEQIDGAVYADGLACLIECKDQAEPVNAEPIAKLRNQLLRRPVATLGAVFSRSGFTEPVEIFAHYLAPQTILLWNGDEFDYALKKGRLRQGLAAKYRFCIEHGSAIYNLREGALR